MSHPRTGPLFIVGLQKSGTTLMNRLISSHPSVDDPFKPEGRFFWGDYPPFSPTHHPCGELYQAHDGKQGHHLSAADFVVEHQTALHHKLNEQLKPDKLLINKNPYNTVRIEWLKSMFPAATIVAMVRHPLANVFSLKKKFMEHNHRGFAPEEHWWGVKPNGWRQLIEPDDLASQLAHQWLRVNQSIIDHLPLVDQVVCYHRLCKNTAHVLQEVLLGFGIKPVLPDHPLKCLDDEYLTGSRLLSKNKEFHQSGFELEINNEAQEIEPLKPSEIAVIEDVCFPLWQQLKSHHDEP